VHCMPNGPRSAPLCPRWLLLATVAVTMAVSAVTSVALPCTSSAALRPAIAQLSLTGTDLSWALVAIITVVAVTGSTPPA
jgi:hypothetical protein